MSSTLNIRGLSVSYGTHEALKNVNLSLQSGELLVVLGPTGAGKTTLLRTIAGLVVPDAGSVTIEGADTTHLPARDVAMVFQNFSLYPNRNVRQNLEFPLRSPTARLTQEQIIDRVEWAAELLRIRHLLNRPSTQLSGGEMQRVAIGRAIVRRPRVFLFDEPLTNLDAKLREVLRVELIKLQKELDVSTIYVTHDQAEALSMADRIAVLADGRITQTGSPSDIYERPDTPEVARQLGYPQINLMDATQDDGFWVSATGDRFAPAQSDAKTAQLGIRPENISTQGGETPGTVRVVEEIGPARILLVDIAGTHLHILTDRSENHAPGDTILPSFDSDQLLVWPNTHTIPQG